jgi:hypothetical protein
MTTAEAGQDRRQPGQHEVLGHPEPQPPADLRAAEVRQRPLARVEDRGRELQHRLPVRGEGDAVGVAGEQGATDLRLEAADVLAHRRLPDAEPVRGAREAQRPRDGDERAQQHRVHAVIVVCDDRQNGVRVST